MQAKLGRMHLELVPPSAGTKRKRPDESVGKPPLSKRQQQEQLQYRAPPAFWDNLSRQHLTRRTLREFDRRTPVARFPPRPQKSSLNPLSSNTVVTLKRFARHGGPDLDDIRAYPEPCCAPAMPAKSRRGRKREDNMEPAESEEPRAKRPASATTRSSAYDPAFEQAMIDNGIFPPGHNIDTKRKRVYPNNWEDIRAKLAQARPSLSPSRFDNEAFEDFEQRNMAATTEREVMNKAFPVIAGDSVFRQGKTEIPFNNLADIAPDIQKQVVVDFYDGSKPKQLKKPIREQLRQYILPSTNTTNLMVPNFFAEGNGPEGSAGTVKRQALHAGAIGARGMQQLRASAHPDEPVDDSAYTITSTYSGGSGGGFLTLYTMHPVKSTDPSRQQDYHMTQIDAFAMTGNAETFRKGATAFRNAHEWARERREELIAAANTRPDKPDSISNTTSAHSGLSQTTAATHLDSDTSVDELGINDPGSQIKAGTSRRRTMSNLGKPGSGREERAQDKEITIFVNEVLRYLAFEVSCRWVNCFPFDVLNLLYSW